MAAIKSYTDLEQSRKLAVFLPLESADMWYSIVDNEPFVCLERHYEYEQTPCWSLAALLAILPKISAEEPMVRKMYYASEPKERYICEYSLTNITSEYDNPVDACVAMIERLHELNLL